MEEQIFDLLTGGVGFSVWWGSLGEGTDLPRAAIFRTSGVRSMHQKGTGLMQTRLQIDCYGKTFWQALGASREVRGLLEGYQGGVVQGVFLESTRDGTETAKEGRIGYRDVDQLLKRVSLTFAVTHND
ncbi:hypothetical protein [Chachezhania sediminis]|uniref:hypothetical protein n=1 Tax=Chachezhania sediminis TaxID=2599291 RepID=UPI001E4CD5D3|nr:hypothetical protein [Chachezhania sediminis]